ncbi:Major facilitator superfamily transporter [Penicillium cf. griseofulvum]|uniref:Major facilitator superfamily transporter n=1 Tax=Penicillium cf. griseofulvum TaxID=2972120 RepID=A0A9W9J1S8_9EURO|nr:Major facilitator superfamily transporter [Penicillium cf. griseofulvum]KAJ5434103.1 Major facilitator superfamily transporter [Penicillium cf. griseofulvum]KAJ5451930.1 Major facilitator superfamily transporter [Penicillium cf. griseofulvum]
MADVVNVSRTVGQEQQTDEEKVATSDRDNVSETAKADETQYVTGIKLFSIGVGLCLAVLCSNLDRSILGVATPEITTEFNSLDDIGWYGSAYLLTSCCSQLMFGKLYAGYNIKWTFLSALAIFEVGSIVCAAAPNSDSLIVGRAIAGLGATGISTGALLIISNIMPVHERPKYTAIVGACMGVTLVIAPFLGGVFTNKLTWRWCFWINLPLGGVTVFLILLLVHLPPRPKSDAATGRALLDKIDLPGTLLLLPSIVCLLLALQWGGTKYDWGNWRCILLFCIFGVLGLIWCYMQVRAGDKATVPMRLLKMRSIVASMWFAFFLFGMMFIQSYYIPIWFQALKGDSAYWSGIHMLTMTVAMTLSFVLTGALTTIIGYYVPSMILGAVISAVSSGMIIKFGAHTSTGYWVGALILSGMGFGLGAQQCMMVPQTILSGEDIALGTSVIMFAETISGAVFLAVCETLFGNKLLEELDKLSPAVNPAAVVANGVAGLKSAMSEIYTASAVDEILESYAKALQPVWIIAVIFGSLSLLGAVFTEWVSVKKDKKEGEKEQLSAGDSTMSNTSIAQDEELGGNDTVYQSS